MDKPTVTKSTHIVGNIKFGLKMSINANIMAPHMHQYFHYDDCSSYGKGVWICM